MKGTYSLKNSWQLCILAFEAKTLCKITIFFHVLAHSVSRRISILLLTYFTLLWTLTKKNDIIKQDTFLKMQSSEHLKIWWTLFRRCLLIIIWKGKKSHLLSWIFLWQFNSHHINAWKNYLKLKWALRFFLLELQRDYF